MPLTLANALQQGYLLVDSLLVGRYVGTQALAAVGATQPVFYLMNAMFIGVSMAFTIRLAHLTGAERSGEVRSVARALLLFTVVWSAGCLVFAMAGAGLLFSAMGIQNPVAGEAERYFQFLSLGFPAVFGIAAISAYLRGLGDSRGAFWILGLSSVLNVGLAWLLVGPADMGLRGVALATAASASMAGAGGIVYARRRHALALPAEGSSPRRELTAALRLGMPLATQHVALSLGIMVLVWVIQPFGPSALAAFTVVGRIELFTSMAFLDLSGALAAFVAQNLGAEQHERITRALRKLVVLGLALSILVSLVLLLGRTGIAAIFSDDALVRQLIERYIVITYPFFALYAIMVIVHGCLNGYQRTTVPLVCTIVAFVLVQVPVAYLLSGPFGISGVMSAAVIGWAVGLAYSLVAARRHFILSAPPSLGF
ncbi:MATE family efflux transporter [Microbispora sp. NPDC046933]|uniref:MATE family efflux transporter n=1 Tax=Microbispora sp. NPDC046933 TaxID=3155618 RepID=UPI0033ED128A